MTGWLINDCLTCIPGTKTFWHNLLDWFPELEDKTNGCTYFSVLAEKIENELKLIKPDYIIRNGTYFRRLNTAVPTISLIQDIHLNNDVQMDVINNSSVVVFNSEYVYEKYRSKISGSPTIRICPLGVDFNFFKPVEVIHPAVLPNSILFIGAANTYPKGFNVLLDIMNVMTDQNFCLIMKDDFSMNELPEALHERVRIFNRVGQETVRAIMNSCIAAVCTSYEETQHLSGIECAACNIPIVARAVGIYYDNRNSQEWGFIAEDSTFVEKLMYVRNNVKEFHPRDCFIKKYSLDECMNNWKQLIESIKNGLIQ